MPATKTEREVFGARLRQLRAPLTIQQVVDRLDEERGTKVSTANMSAWERGEYAPKTRDLVMDLDLVLDGKGELLELLGYPTDWPVEPNADAWGIVGKFVMETRIELNCSSDDLADQAAVPHHVVVAIEEGAPEGGSAGVRDLWHLSLALCLWPSALERLAQGADPGATKVSSQRFWEYLDEVEHGYEGRHQRHITEVVQARRSRHHEYQTLQRLTEIEARLAALDGKTPSFWEEGRSRFASDEERERRILGYTHNEALEKSITESQPLPAAREAVANEQYAQAAHGGPTESVDDESDQASKRVASFDPGPDE